MAHHILIIGGGIGGTMTANHLVVKLYPELLSGKVRITMLSNSPWHYYKPAFMYVAFNAFFRDELRRKQRGLLRPEIDFQVEEVESFDFPAQSVQCKSGKRFHYDHLVISTGCVPSPERIAGLAEGGDHFYQHGPARKLADKLTRIEKGRIFITVTFPKTPNVPHQCGIAPIETTLMLDDLLRRRGVRDKVEIIYTYPTVSQLLRNCLFLQRDTCEILPTVFEQRGIRYQRGFTLSHVDPDAKIAYSEEGESEDFDILMATPPFAQYRPYAIAVCPRHRMAKVGSPLTTRRCKCWAPRMSTCSATPWIFLSARPVAPATASHLLSSTTSHRKSASTVLAMHTTAELWPSRRWDSMTECLFGMTTK